ncbi:hypothetical protein ZEAMMB73_Zm00001d044740 [Zea mays]|uniref:DUF7895 domain-containing protein n=1 Tax=Zea mays TaxID=4577 RepID=A0A1D6NR41_MAIZE|nr:hypothetical protein ZEAMMB73_Zm00001d044740 [Zea mays]
MIFILIISTSLVLHLIGIQTRISVNMSVNFCFAFFCIVQHTLFLAFGSCWSHVGHSGAKVPDCGGTGLCSRCKGECFVFKQLSKETATRSHKAAKNMATGYTSGYCCPPMDLLQQVLLHPRACIKWQGFYQQSTHM